MDKEIVFTKQAPAPIGPYSQGVKVKGFIFTAGQIALKADETLVERGAGAQARQVMMNLQAVLRAGGADLSDVVKTTIFLADMGDFGPVNEIYGSYFAAEPPARVTVQAAALPRGALIEIDAIAVVAKT